MPRLAVGFFLALAATASSAQDMTTKSQTPAIAKASERQPFLYDGRMWGDGGRQRKFGHDHNPNTGAIVMPPNASQPERKR